jgi:D-3-phosphoglycerate dehydrogenase
VDANVIDRLKAGSYVINTARAEVLDYPALTKAVKEKGIRVALDVFPKEPAAATADFTHEIVGLPNVYATHHIGASTNQAQEAIAAETVRIVKTYMESGRVPNVVNLEKHSPATHALIIRHKDRPGVLAHVFDCVRDAGINVQETENVIFARAEAAVARVNMDKPPTPELQAKIRTNKDILDLHIVTMSEPAGV